MGYGWLSVIVFDVHVCVEVRGLAKCLCERWRSVVLRKNVNPPNNQPHVCPPPKRTRTQENKSFIVERQLS